MWKMKRYNIVLFTLIVCACSVQAQTVEPITYKQYMHKVSADNLEYAAEKMNVSCRTCRCDSCQSI